MQNIRQQFIDKYIAKDFNESGLLEIIGASFIANEESIFGVVDYEYIKQEIRWYNSKSLNVFDLCEGKPPKMWIKTASNKGYINSNYGWCIFSNENGNQFGEVINKLRNNLHTKRAIMIYTRPGMHVDAIENGKNDFICTNAVTYRYTANALHAIVQMRSNDVIYGYKNDRAWQLHVLGLLCNELNLNIGNIYWQAASLHIYPRHFKILEKYIHEDE